MMDDASTPIICPQEKASIPLIYVHFKNPALAVCPLSADFSREIRVVSIQIRLVVYPRTLLGLLESAILLD
jgi:hypothetical protein